MYNFILGYFVFGLVTTISIMIMLPKCAELKDVFYKRLALNFTMTSVAWPMSLLLLLTLMTTSSEDLQKALARSEEKRKSNDSRGA